MPLRLDIQVEGAYLLPWAKTKLVQMKAFMQRSKVRVLTRIFPIGGVAQVRIESLFMKDDVWMDKIKITAGAPSFLTLVSLPDVTPFRSLFFGSHSQGSNVRLSGGTILGATTGQTFTGAWSYTSLSTAAFLLSDGSSLVVTVPPDVETQDGGAFGVAREKNRLKTNSTNALAQLTSGVLPALANTYQWEPHLNKVPGSAAPWSASQFTVELIGPEVPGSLFTDIGSRVSTRTVRLSYINAAGVLREQVIQGTRTETNIARGNGFIQSVQFNTFPAMRITSTGGTYPGPFGALTYIRPHGPIGRFSLASEGDVWNGSVAPEFFVLSPGLINEGNSTRSDSTYATPNDVVGDTDGLIDVPNLVNTISTHTAELYLQYLAEAVMVDIETINPTPGFNNSWHYFPAYLQPGDTALLYPLSPVKGAEDLGLFSNGRGESPDKIRIHGEAKVKYGPNFDLTLVKWTPMDKTVLVVDTFAKQRIIDLEPSSFPPGTDWLASTRSELAARVSPAVFAAFMLNYRLARNGLVKTNKFRWKDQRAVVKNQAQRLVPPPKEAPVPSTQPTTDAERLMMLIERQIS
ncbi:MAG: hypothetical protein DDT20_00678 [Firmicutes bacterium]|nr:hypothetical protein [Bacillota bacterium]